MLLLEDVDAFYGPIQALRGVSLRVDEGEMVALLGSNGAGKTTTLRSASGMLNPSKGHISVDGHDVSSMKPWEVVRLGVAHLPEGRELFPEATVLENLRLGHWSRRQSKTEERSLLDQVMTMLPRLAERSGQAAGTLSGGEQQMLVVARALMSRPKLMLIDELSLGLAPLIVQQLFDTLNEVNKQGTAILLVEQFVHLALRNTSRAYVLVKGEVSLAGRSQELLASPDVMRAYLGDMEVGSADAPPAETPSRRSARKVTK